MGVYVKPRHWWHAIGDQIDQARQALMGAWTRPAKRREMPRTMNAAKEIYGALFDSLKAADGVDHQARRRGEGLSLAGILTVKPDTALAKAGTPVHIPAQPPSSLAIPPDSSFYVYMNMDASTVDRLQGMSMRMMNPGGKPTPEPGQGSGPLVRQAGSRRLAVSRSTAACEA